MTAQPPFLTRVRIQNYKSIKACDVRLGSLAFLVGPNGSGKSNFLDALRFVADALNESPDKALNDRIGEKIRIITGAISDVQRKGSDSPSALAIRLDFQIPDGLAGHYSLQISHNAKSQFTKGEATFTIQKEECSTSPDDWFVRSAADISAYSSDGHIRFSALEEGTIPHDQLVLSERREIEPFKTVYHALTRMCFYNLNPDAIRKLQESDSSPLLQHDGANLPSVLERLENRSPATKKRIEEYLGHIIPGLRSVEPFSPGGSKGTESRTFAIHQGLASDRADWPGWSFLPLSNSDGTLRALGILTALLQDSDGSPSLVAIEEPELGLHPAALAALLDAICDARERTQVLVTSHSPDLLHTSEIGADELLAVEAESGATVISGIDEGSRETLRKRLFTPGELLRTNLLQPDEAAREIESRQLQLFDR